MDTRGQKKRESESCGKVRTAKKLPLRISQKQIKNKIDYIYLFFKS